MRNSPLKGIIKKAMSTNIKSAAKQLEGFGRWKLDKGTKEGQDIMKQYKNVKTVSSSDIGRVTKNISKLKKLKNIKNIFSIANPLGAVGILDVARKLNIKGGRTTDVYQKRKRNYMDSGKSQLN